MHQTIVNDHPMVAKFFDKKRRHDMRNRQELEDMDKKDKEKNGDRLLATLYHVDDKNTEMMQKKQAQLDREEEEAEEDVQKYGRWTKVKDAETGQWKDKYIEPEQDALEEASFVRDDGGQSALWHQIIESTGLDPNDPENMAVIENMVKTLKRQAEKKKAANAKKQTAKAPALPAVGEEEEAGAGPALRRDDGSLDIDSSNQRRLAMLAGGASASGDGVMGAAGGASASGDGVMGAAGGAPAMGAAGPGVRDVIKPPKKRTT